MKQILLVCTGNICRSPLAAALLTRALAERGVEGIDVSSAGTRARDGAPPSEGADLAVLGDPVAPSLSPVMYTPACRALGLDAVYVALPASPAALPSLLAALAAVGAAGNVTVPHKEAAERCLAQKTALCAQVGACNTFWSEHGTLVGDNTDVAGVLGALRTLGGDGAAGGGGGGGASWLVIGTGGAARAVAVAAAEEIGRATCGGRV